MRSIVDENFLIFFSKSSKHRIATPRLRHPGSIITRLVNTMNKNEVQSLEKLINKGQKRKRGNNYIGVEGQDKRPRTYIRIPKKNLLPNKRVSLKEEDRRGKHSKKKAQEEILRLQQNGTRTRNANHFSVDVCSNCGSDADIYFIRTKEYDVVCKKCGAVQEGEISYENEVTTLSQTPTTNKKITYISERLRLFGNREPRIASTDIAIIGQTFSQLHTLYCKDKFRANNTLVNTVSNQEREEISVFPYSLFEHLNVDAVFGTSAGNLNKRSVRELLQLIDQLDQEKVPRTTKNFEKKYTERWLQIKIYLMFGEVEYEKSVCPLPKTELLDALVYKASLVVDLYEKHKENIKVEKKKKNMLSLDLLFLLLLNTEGQLEQFGWYFISHVLHKTYVLSATKTNPSMENDYESYQFLFKYLNSKEPNLALKLPDGGVRELIQRSSESRAYIF